jgi:hypothetical protein
VNFERREIAASEAGGLMAYAPSSFTISRRSASYIDKILKGTKPGLMTDRRVTLEAADEVIE